MALTTCIHLLRGNEEQAHDEFAIGSSRFDYVSEIHVHKQNTYVVFIDHKYKEPLKMNEMKKKEKWNNANAFGMENKT